MSPVLRTTLFAVATAAFLAGSVADAAAWVCTARSRVASGWGSSVYFAQARGIALQQCAIRTPRGYMCRIVRCR
ncbi:hypothetical protein EYW49_18315 [Siculibacillus lacustris]|uniref:DUF4189 domain-containing protein n=1 Tax=Siculibacillus lacustris TaxID=1549641 RepID=A0A4Q9VHC9_9HYPH|nr:hypothetical protein [Siculibacillus lacustris]TBW34394.1 hypothetical protein EYW49_18315 [Siculibacillus lacustris]